MYRARAGREPSVAMPRQREDGCRERPELALATATGRLDRRLLAVDAIFVERLLVFLREVDQSRGSGLHLECEFILRDLNRSDETEDEVCFSYTPLDRTRVFNASLLAGEALAQVGALTHEAELSAHALRAARYVVRRQRDDGSWAYGADSYQSWSDNFHTAFVLTSLARILKARGQKLKGDAVKNHSADGDEIRQAIGRGYEFWRSSFFLADGWPKYYHHSAHPADAHSAGAAVVACAELRDIEPGAQELAARVARWAVRELFDRRGFFYYQKRRLYTARTPYMRWSQAWMMYALARLLEMMNAE